MVGVGSISVGSSVPFLVEGIKFTAHVERLTCANVREENKV